MSPVVFLDIDGVLILASGAHGADRRLPGTVDCVRRLCEATGAKIVVTSDRRCDGLRSVEDLLGTELTEYLHESWKTPVCGHRVDEIRTWILRHSSALTKGENLNFVIIDDFEGHFKNVHMEIRNRLVLCDSRVGFNEENLKEALEKISQDLFTPGGVGKVP